MTRYSNATSSHQTFISTTIILDESSDHRTDGAAVNSFGNVPNWVHSRQFPDAQDKWDGNWLNVTAHCGQARASVWASGAILDTIGLMRCRDELEKLHQTLSGAAVLESHEPNVVVRVSAADAAGHLRARVEITPDHLAQGNTESD